VEIKPEPTADERRAILLALESVEAGAAAAYGSRWRASALDDLRDGALTEEGGSDTGVVEP
jgi:hypothetical protein